MLMEVKFRKEILKNRGLVKWAKANNSFTVTGTENDLHAKERLIDQSFQIKCCMGIVGILWLLRSITVKQGTRKDKSWWTTMVVEGFYSFLVYLSRIICVALVLNIHATLLKQKKICFCKAT